MLEGVCFYILQNLSRDARAKRLDQHDLQLGEDREHHHRAPFNTILRRTRDCVEIACTRSVPVSDVTIKVERAFGPVVEGEAVVSREGFSPRYDLDRWTRRHHQARPQARRRESSATRSSSSRPRKAASRRAGRSTTSSTKGIAPKALVFGVTNPVMVQGAVFADITITEGWSSNALDQFSNRDVIRIDPQARTIVLLRKAVAA